MRRGLVKGMGGIGVAAGAGAIGAFTLAQLSQNVAFLRENWWASPAAALAIALVVAKWNATAGLAIAGITGVLLAIKFTGTSSSSTAGFLADRPRAGGWLVPQHQFLLREGYGS